MKLISCAFLYILLVLFSSCGLIYRGVLGVDMSPQWFENDDIIKTAKKYGVETDFHLILDTASYTNAIKAALKDTVDALNKDTSLRSRRLRYKAQTVAKDDLQPVQVRLFTSEGLESFKLVNCYIDPPIPMDWNVNQCFDSFPLHADDIIQNTHNYDLHFLLSHTTRHDSKKVKQSDLPDSEYYIVVMWNSFMIRPSKRLIQTVKEYIAANSEHSITPIYINNHNQQIWGQLDAEQKQQVIEYETELKKEALE